MIALPQSPAVGWVYFRWPYPGTDKVRRKASHIATSDEGFFREVEV